MRTDTAEGIVAEDDSHQNIRVGPEPSGHFVHVRHISFAVAMSAVTLRAEQVVRTKRNRRAHSRCAFVRVFFSRIPRYAARMILMIAVGMNGTTQAASVAFRFIPVSAMNMMEPTT